MRVMMLGVGGLLGPYLLEAFSDQEVFSVAHRTEFNLCDPIQVACVLAWEPDIVINAAAETNVELCESKPMLAIDSNTSPSLWLARYLKPEAKLVYISTDSVYPDSIGPHTEISVGPVNMYGRSKLAGEHNTAQHENHLILRTNFFGFSKTDNRWSFSDWVEAKLTDGSTPLFFNDVFWNPLHMKTVSELIYNLSKHDVRGTYNLAASTIMSKAAFAGAVAEHLGLLEQFNKAAIGPSNYSVKRTRDLSMDCQKIVSLMGYEMPSLEEEIKKL